MTIFKVLSGAVWGKRRLDCLGGSDTPKDMDDFGRCYRLIEAVPEWKERLGEVADTFPAWGPFIREWESLERLYLSEEKGTYSLFQKLTEKSRIIDGWKKTGTSSWERGE